MAKRSKPRRSKSSSWPARSCANNLAVNGWDVVWFFKKKEMHCKNVEEVSNNYPGKRPQTTWGSGTIICDYVDGGADDDDDDDEEDEDDYVADDDVEDDEVQEDDVQDDEVEDDEVEDDDVGKNEDEDDIAEDEVEDG